MSIEDIIELVDSAFDKTEEVDIKPTSDLFIGVFLSNPSNESILINLISAVLTDFGLPPITSAKVGNPFSLKDYSVEKQIILDVRVRDELGRYYNIEVQTFPHTSFKERILFGWAKTYSGQAIRGIGYEDLNQTIVIVITEFKIFPSSSKIHMSFVVCEKDEPHILLSDHLQLHLLRLQPLLNGELDKLNSVSPQLAYWMIFLAFGKESEETMQKLYKEQPLIKEAFEQSAIQQAQEQFRRFISEPVARDMERRHREFLFLQQSAVKMSHKEGRAEGKIEGRIEGKTEGRIEGKIEDAIEMKAMGFSLSDIVRVTKLSEEEIEKLS